MFYVLVEFRTVSVENMPPITRDQNDSLCVMSGLKLKKIRRPPAELALHTFSIPPTFIVPIIKNIYIKRNDI